MSGQPKPLYRIVTPQQFQQGYLRRGKIGKPDEPVTVTHHDFEKVEVLSDGNILVKEIPEE